MTITYDQGEPVEDPALPYAGTSGFSGTSTSEAATRKADDDGTTASKQAKALRMIEATGSTGVTVHDLKRTLDPHHGTSSRILTTLHIAGDLARLSEKRGGCKVYVRPAYIVGRETEPAPTGTRKRALTAAERAALDQVENVGWCATDEDIRLVAAALRRFTA